MTGRSKLLASAAFVGLSGALVVTLYGSRLMSTGPQTRAMPGGAAAFTGDEIVAIFVGASFCGATSAPDLPQVLEDMRRSLGTRASEEHKRLVTVGVALDVSPDDGLKFLSHYGRFDEVLAGRNWLNTGAIDYIWRDTPGAASLPQLIVLERHVDEGKTSISVGTDHLIRREIGIEEIRNWVKMNTPLR